MLTIIATILTFPFAFYFEGGSFLAQWTKSTAVVGSGWLARQMALDGFYYYAYNEVAFITLNQVAPVTHSIAHTFVAMLGNMQDENTKTGENEGTNAE